MWIVLQKFCIQIEKLSLTLTGGYKISFQIPILTCSCEKKRTRLAKFDFCTMRKYASLAVRSLAAFLCEAQKNEAKA